MHPRKRGLSANRIDNKRSKRAKLISDLWDPQSESISSYNSASSRDSTYTIRAIIGEKPGAYLIDWADDRFTGQAYSPDWISISNQRRTSVARPFRAGKTDKSQRNSKNQGIANANANADAENAPAV
ncbi:MAG: hypothetical protein LQ350_001774 [Teloschistes chrysophthalmus]|nr:MAG: hypothetical protein LQ350_001774 [Niorma chrysophthalma]